MSKVLKYPGVTNVIPLQFVHKKSWLEPADDRTIILWDINKTGQKFGSVSRCLTGHGGSVQDVVLSSDFEFALSGSSDCELRLWDLQTGITARRFPSHVQGVLSVALSTDFRIVSASRDQAISVWNTRGECPYTFKDQDQGAHSDRVSCVSFLLNNTQHTIVSGSWDKTVKIWDVRNFQLTTMLNGHSENVSTVAVSPNGSVASGAVKGGRGSIILWDLAREKILDSLNTPPGSIRALCYHPTRDWLCAATDSGIFIWDLKNKHDPVVLHPVLQGNKTLSKGTRKAVHCTALNWSTDGSTLFSLVVQMALSMFGVFAL